MVAAETLTHMAATSNWPISALRDEALALCDRKNWPTNRLAAELGMLQSTVENSSMAARRRPGCANCWCH